MSAAGFNVREAEDYDLATIHSLGSNAPELSVGGAGGEFPTLDELERDDLADWLVVEDGEGHVWGFCCARTGDADRTGGQRSACIVYLFVHEKFRRRGLAKKLLDAMTFQLQCAGVDHVYSWANPNSGIVEFFERARFNKGKPCVWMDFALPGGRR